MNRTYKIGLLAAVLYIIIELVIVALGYNHSEEIHIIAWGINTMCLLVAVTYSILSEFNFELAKGKGVSLLHDIKSGLRTVSVYAVTIAFFIFAYYQWIDPEYPEIRRERFLAGVENKQFEEQAKAKMEAAPEMYEGKSIDDLRDMNEESTNMILSSSFKIIFPITLFSLLLLGMIYTFIITGFNRLVLVKLLVK